MDTGLQPAAWHDQFVAFATAAAALLGLFFVAISLHPAEVERHPYLRNRARINLQVLSGFLALSLAVLTPEQKVQWLGAEFLLITLIVYSLTLFGLLSARAKLGAVPRGVAIRFGIQMAALLIQVAAGISLLVGRGPGLYLEVPVVLIAMPSCAFNAWNVIFDPERENGAQAPLANGSHAQR